MALLPANPGQALWLGADSGKYHANVGIGGPGGDLDHTDYSQSAIEDGFSLANYFYLDGNGDVVFKQLVENGRTSTNTKYARTELRELQPNGVDKAAWNSGSGTFSDEAIFKIDHVPSAKPWVVFFQVHDPDSDFFRVQTEDGAIVCRRSPPGTTSEIRTVLRSSYTVGAWIAGKWQFDSGRLRIWLDGTVVLDVTGMSKTGCYAKLGCYNQVNNRSDGGNAATGEYCQVTVQRGSLKRVRPGYPASTTPVFTGGTDPNGGAGQVGGVDTQPPTSPTGLTVTPEGSGLRLRWNASTDNVGVDHYNIYRSGGAGGAGGGGGGAGTGTFAAFGNVDGGADTTLSSADKIVSSKFVAGSAGTLTGGHGRLWLSASGSTTARMLVYADSSGAPGALLATSDQITVTATTESVRDFVFSGANRIAITAGTPYWLALTWGDPGTPSVVYSRDNLSGLRLERSDITYGSFPNPFGTATGVFAGPIDVWAELNGVAGGGGGTTSSFGKQTDGPSSSASTADKTAVSLAAATATGTLTAGHARAWLSAAGSANTKLVVYADSSGAPGAKLAESDVVAVTSTTEGVRNYTFSGGNQIPIANGASYWIGLAWQDPGTPSLNLSRDAATGGRREVSSYAPNPFGTPTTLTGPIDVYLDITAGTGGDSGGAAGFVLIATTAITTYLDAGIAVVSGQTRGVGGIATPPAGPNVVLVTADSSSRLNITTSGRTYDGQGHTVAGITIGAPGSPVDNVTVQNFNIHDAHHDGVSIFGAGDTVQNCDFARIDDGGQGDINGITLFGDGHRVLYNNAGVSDFMATGTIGGSHTDFVQVWNTSSKRSTSNLIVQGNRIDGPGTSDARFVHQIVQMEGQNSTDGGGGGTGVSSGILIADNIINAPQVNQALNFLDIHDVQITRNTFAGSASKQVGTGDGSTGIVYYDDNIVTGSYGSVGVSTTAGPGPAGVGGASGGTPPAYTYAVTAVDAAGNESAGAPGGGSGGPPDTQAPTVPTNLTAVVREGRVALVWDPSTDNVGVTGYTVRRGGVAVATVAATSYVDVDVVTGTVYSYTVSALDAAGNASAQSSAVSAAPAAVGIVGAPLLPGRLDGGRVELAIAWGADLTADEATWVWTDITDDVRQDPGISVTLGRNDESTTSNPANLTAVLDNSRNDYSLGTLSGHYPNVRRNTPVRLRIDPGDGAGGRVVVVAFADGFTPGWDVLTGNIPVVTLSASGALRRLSQGSSPLQSAYRRVMTALDSVKAYWPFEEGNSSTFAPAVRGGGDMVLSVDSATPGATPGRPDWAANTAFDCSAPLPSLNDGYLQADVFAYPDTGASQVRFLLAIPDNGLSDGMVLAHFTMTGSVTRWDLTYEIVNGGTCLGLFRYGTGGYQTNDIIGFDINGKPGRVSLDWTQSGSNIIWTLGFTEAAPGASAGYVRATIAGRTAGIVSHIEINPHNANLGVGFGHLTVENKITSFFTDTDALTANFGETITGGGGRLTRLCTENGVPLQLYGGTPTPTTALDHMGPQLVAPLLTLLRECETADQGQLWDGRNAGLSYTTRRRRGLGTVKLTVDAAAGQLAGDFQAVDDDQRNRNRMTVTRLHGVAYTYEDTDGPLGTRAIGVYDDSITVNTMADASTVDFARWFVKLGTVAGYRYPTVTVDLAASPQLAPAVLDIIPGERIDVTGLDSTLAGFPDATVSLIVEGIAHEVTTRSWKATFRCSPYAPWAAGLGGP